jgi:hypothetical protein
MKHAIYFEKPISAQDPQVGLGHSALRVCFSLAAARLTFPDMFAHSPLSVASGSRMYPIASSKALVTKRLTSRKALVTKRLTSSCYACRLAAPAAKADAALCFFQNVNATHFPSPHWNFKEKVELGLIPAEPWKRDIDRWIGTGRHSKNNSWAERL